MRLQPRLLLVTGGIFVLFAAASLMVSYRAFDRLLADELRKEADNIRGVLMATRRVYHKQFVASGLPVNDTTVGFLPAHALPRISREFSNWNDSGLSFNNVSDRPRNPDNRADSFEMTAIAFFRANPQSEERITKITASDGQRYYHYTQPMWIEGYCLKCHGRRAAAPASIAERYVEAYDYQIGDLRGVLSIKIPMRNLQERLWSMWRDQVLAYLLGYALLFAALTWVVRQAVTRRLSRLEDKARLLQAGDYASHGEMDGTDEIASLGASLDQMAKAIARRETELRRFAEVTTHHLQEPARRVACYAERLTAQVAAQLHDPEARLSLEFIRQQAQRQQTLLRDIERYLAADEPRGPLGPTDAAALLRQWQDANAADIAAVGASLQIGELPPAWIDAPRLAELFELALDNALQHGKSRRRTDGAALHIEVTGERLDGTVRYAVSDNGPGIEAAYRERVFTVFERLTTDVEGTGIGLSIVRRIAESIGGRAWIDATPDGGCRLLLELPAGEPR